MTSLIGAYQSTLKLIKFRLIISYISQMQESNPHQSNSIISSTYTIQTKTHDRILQAIKSLISPNTTERTMAEYLLTQQRIQNYSDLLRQIIHLINFTHDEKDKYLCLLYLRDILHSFSLSTPMVDIVAQLENMMCTVPDNCKELAVQCMNLYLNKKHNHQYKKYYVSNLINKLDESLKKKTLNVPLIKNIIDILGHPSQTNKSGNKFSNYNQKVIHTILLKCSVGQFFGEQPVAKEWVQFVLALCNYTGFVPNSQFVIKNLVNNEGGNLGVCQILSLTKFFNKMTHKINDVGVTQMYNILDVQLKRIRNQQFLQKLSDQLDDGESFSVMIKSIQFVSTNIIKRRKSQLNPTPSQMTIFNDLTNVLFLTNMAEVLLGLPDLTATEKQPIYQLISSLIREYEHSTAANPMTIYSYINALCQKLSYKENSGLSSIYQLMANININIMKYFQYSKIIEEGYNQILHNNWRGYEFYLKMVDHYLRNVQVIDQWAESSPVIAKLIKHFLSLTPSPPLARLKPLTFAIMCQYYLITYNQLFKLEAHINTKQLQRQKFQEILNIGNSLLTQILNAKEIDQESVDMVLKGMRDLSKGVKQYLDSFHKSIVIYIQNSAKNNVMSNIYIQLLRLMGSYMQMRYIQDCTIISVCRMFLQCNNQGLKYQCCELLLSALILTNRSWYKNIISQSHAQQIILNIMGSNLLGYIQSNLEEENDQCLFSKILMEIVIHEPGYLVAKNMLIKVVNKIQNCLHLIYDFDRVWEAMVILYGEKNNYVDKKGIGLRVEELKMGKMQEMLNSMSILDQEEMKSRKPSMLKWSQLPDVRRVIDPNSIVGEYINNKIHGISN